MQEAGYCAADSPASFFISVAARYRFLKLHEIVKPLVFSQEFDNSWESLLFFNRFCDMITSIIVNKERRSYEENKMASKDTSFSS